MKKLHVTRRTLILALATLTTIANFDKAFAETTQERVKAGGNIRIGITASPPIAYKTPDGKLTGHDVEVVKAVLNKLGINQNQIEPVLLEFGGLIPGLKAQRIDMIVAGMYINPKRCEEVAFSDPIFRFGEAILVKKGNPKNIKDLSSFAKDKSLIFAIVTSGMEGQYAKEAGADPSQLLPLRDSASIVAAVESGRADGGGLPGIQLADIVKRTPNLEVTPTFFEVAGKSIAGYGGIGFRKEDKDLQEAFNKQLKSYLGSPEYLAMAEPFGFGKDTLPNKTAAELCTPR